MTRPPPGSATSTCADGKKVEDDAIAVRTGIAMDARSYEYWLGPKEMKYSASGVERSVKPSATIRRAQAVLGVIGVTKVADLREKYGLTVDAGLGRRIADDLMSDRHSPLAPTLQLLLTWMYEDAKAALLEAYLLDFEGDLYGQPAKVRFVDRLRGEEKFDSVEALIAQIGDDVAAARQVLSRSPGGA